MEDLIRDLGIDEKLTKAPRGIKKFNKVKDMMPKVEDYNMQADLLFLPTAKGGYKYLLAMVDLANNEFDIEPLKSKTAEAVLKATQAIFKRGILKLPEASIRTDSGTEFKSVYAQFMHDNNVMHKISLPDRHKQTGNVERLNKELSRIIMGYLDTKDQKSVKENEAQGKSKKKSKVNTDWSHLVPIIRERLNKIRKIDLPKGDKWKTMEYPTWNPATEKTKTKTVKGKKVKVSTRIKEEPQYKVGDRVHHVIDRPENARGEKQIGGFRQGDHRWSSDKKRIRQVLLYTGLDVPYRYLLDGITQASFTRYELKK